MNPTPETPSGQPCPCANGKTRRDFMFQFGVGINVLAGVLFGLPLIGSVLASRRRKRPAEWISLGPVEKFPAGSTRLAEYRNPLTRPWDGKTGDIPCWVRALEGGKFQIFAINCTHLGCPVRWFEQSRLFMCPCHGGAYYEDGSRAAGPPPRGLFEYEHKIENGELVVKGGFIPTLARPLSTT